jgi:putative phosphoesterase
MADERSKDNRRPGNFGPATVGHEDLRLIGLISDVHANLPALETVLAELDARGVDGIFNAGDLVCYGPSPNEVIHLLREREIVSIYGNRDREVYEFPLRREEYRENLHPLKFRAYEWTYNELTEENLEYLKSLPERVSTRVNSHKLLMVHDRIHPKIPQPKPDTPDIQFEEIAASVEEDIIVFGHTHIQFIREIAGKIFVNTGSVGRPGDGDPRAGYVVLEISEGRIAVRIKRASYDVDRTVGTIYKSDLPDEFALMFQQGKKLDDIIELCSSNLI